MFCQLSDVTHDHVGQMCFTRSLLPFHGSLERLRGHDAEYGHLFQNMGYQFLEAIGSMVPSIHTGCFIGQILIRTAIIPVLRVGQELNFFSEG